MYYTLKEILNEERRRLFMKRKNQMTKDVIDAIKERKSIHAYGYTDS